MKFVPKVSDSLSYLGQGEREGITLAETLRAKMILIDDLPGRLEAESEEAASRDLIVLSDALNSLRANFYTAPALISRLLKEDEQRRQSQ